MEGRSLEMTTTQITAILGEENLDSVLHIDKLHYVTFSKDKNVIFPNRNKYRLEFDTTNEILKIYTVRAYSIDGTEPTHGNFDTLVVNGESVIFEFLTDTQGETIVDYYSFESIVTIGLKGVEAI
jgi:hypothetical protein